MQIVDSVSTSRTDVAVERIGMERYSEIQALNAAIFEEARVIYRLDRADLMLLLASRAGQPVGFKVGYAENRTTFYSAKGGVLASERRGGVARALLARMAEEARAMGYVRFAYDTFPNKHPGMTVLGLASGFTVVAAGYNAAYRDYRLRFERRL
jgi:GNAT superfamily N-acetyltransferase